MQFPIYKKHALLKNVTSLSCFSFLVLLWVGLCVDSRLSCSRWWCQGGWFLCVDLLCGTAETVYKLSYLLCIAYSICRRGHAICKGKRLFCFYSVETFYLSLSTSVAIFAFLKEGVLIWEGFVLTQHSKIYLLFFLWLLLLFFKKHVFKHLKLHLVFQLFASVPITSGLIRSAPWAFMGWLTMRRWDFVVMYEFGGLSHSHK